MIYINIYTYAYTLYVHIYVYIYIYIHTYICIYICIYFKVKFYIRVSVLRWFWAQNKIMKIKIFNFFFIFVYNMPSTSIFMILTSMSYK